MLSRTVISRASRAPVQPWILFMTKNRTKFSGAECGHFKAVSRAYKALGPAKKKALVAQAKTMTKYPTPSKATLAQEAKINLLKRSKALSEATKKTASLDTYKKFVAAIPAGNKFTIANLVQRWKVKENRAARVKAALEAAAAKKAAKAAKKIAAQK